MAINYSYQRTFKTLFLPIFVVCLFSVFTLPSLAQQRKQTPMVQEENKGDLDLEKKKKDLKMFLDKIEILGRIEKPQTLFIVPGNDPTVDDIQIDRSFFKEIFRTIEKDNFPRLVNMKSKKPILW